MVYEYSTQNQMNLHIIGVIHQYFDSHTEETGWTSIKKLLRKNFPGMQFRRNEVVALLQSGPSGIIIDGREKNGKRQFWLRFSCADWYWGRKTCGFQHAACFAKLVQKA